MLKNVLTVFGGHVFLWDRSLNKNLLGTFQVLLEEHSDWGPFSNDFWDGIKTPAPNCRRNRRAILMRKTRVKQMAENEIKIKEHVQMKGIHWWKS